MLCRRPVLVVDSPPLTLSLAYYAMSSHFHAALAVTCNFDRRVRSLINSTSCKAWASVEGRHSGRLQKCFCGTWHHTIYSRPVNRTGMFSVCIVATNVTLLSHDLVRYVRSVARRILPLCSSHHTSPYFPPIRPVVH